jgi:hypothetical protein
MNEAGDELGEAITLSRSRSDPFSSIRRFRSTRRLHRANHLRSRAAVLATAPRLALTLALSTVAGCLTPPAVLPAAEVDFEQALATCPAGTQRVAIEVDSDVVLRGVFVPSDPDAPVVLHLLESAGSVASTRGGLASVARELSDLGFASLIVDYTGVGASSGSASPKNLARDAQSMWDECVRRTGGNPARVVVRATSIGTLAAGSLLASGVRPGAVILLLPVMPDTVVRHFAREFHGSFVGWIASVVYSDVIDLDLVGALTRADMPLLALSSPDEKFIDAEERARLRAAVESAGGRWCERTGGHIELTCESRVLFTEETELLRAFHVPPTEARSRATLAALPPEIAARFPVASPERARLEELCAYADAREPLWTAAVALNCESAREGWRLRRLIPRIAPTKSFDELCAWCSLDDPAGRLPIEELERLCRPLDTLERFDVPRYDPAPLELSATADREGLQAEFTLTVTLANAVNVSFAIDPREVWDALVSRGLDHADAVRQLGRILLKSYGYVDRWRRNDDGSITVEVLENGAWRKLEPPPPGTDPGVRFKLAGFREHSPALARRILDRPQRTHEFDRGILPTLGTTANEFGESLVDPRSSLVLAWSPWENGDPRRTARIREQVSKERGGRGFGSRSRLREGITMRVLEVGRSRFGLISLLCFGALATSAIAQSPAARQVAAPASDIVSGLVRLPYPSSTPTISCAAVFPLRFVREPNVGWIADVSVPVERRGAVALAMLSPDAGAWRVEVGVGGAAPRPIAESFALERRTGFASDSLPGWIIDRYDLSDAPAGRWTVRVEAADPSGARPPLPSWLAMTSDPSLRVESYVTTNRLVGDEPIGIVARLSGASPGTRVDRARLVLENTGRTEELAMLDDGQHEDASRDDGLFGALVPPNVRGQVTARIELSGTIGAGLPFLRSTQLTFPVLERSVLLDGSARARSIDEHHVEIEIGSLPLTAAHRFHVSAEVWGRASDRRVPICWLSREAEIEASSPSSTDATGASVPSARTSSSDSRRTGPPVLRLVLDTRWLEVSGASAPLELRQVRVQDPDTEVVLDLVDRIRLEAPSIPSLSFAPNAGTGPHEITSEMLTGGTSLALNSTSPTGPATRPSPVLFNPALMLVHGYCSSGSIWPAADFTQPKLQFLDPNANRTNDQFAQLINAQAQAAGLSSFGVVTHSQGGCAALHLLTYYTSGLDFSTGGRRIQALAAPFQGTPLASLGFFACGVNNDLTPSGAATWLAGIPTWARTEVYYWTTSDAGTGTACNALTNLFLVSPNDGTVEEIHGQLPSGGNNMGHTLGWCHTTGMNYPASYTDHTRNQAMNAAAAR